MQLAQCHKNIWPEEEKFWYVSPIRYYLPKQSDDQAVEYLCFAHVFPKYFPSIFQSHNFQGNVQGFKATSFSSGRASVTAGSLWVNWSSWDYVTSHNSLRVTASFKCYLMSRNVSPVWDEYGGRAGEKVACLKVFMTEIVTLVNTLWHYVPVTFI